MKEIYHCFNIGTSTDKVYTALTTKTGLSGWWTRNAEVDGAVGSVSTFRFSSGAFNKMLITKAEPEKIEWKCVDGHDEWKETKITFELRQEGEKTKVCFSHYGFREQTEYVGECSFHWAYYLTSLQQYCETGTGTPNEGAGN
jgi:uncharacterized protein YndB with AHSA1/START domain